jgi:hypothetical protein
MFSAFEITEDSADVLNGRRGVSLMGEDPYCSDKEVGIVVRSSAVFHVT